MDILNEIDYLLKYPENYSPDKYKINNDNSFRAFELHHYRISYRYVKDEVRIIRIRHTKNESTGLLKAISLFTPAEQPVACIMICNVIRLSAAAE